MGARRERAAGHARAGHGGHLQRADVCIEHLRFNVAIARDVLPPVPYVHLPQAVCQLCAALRKVQEEHAEDQLLAIAADGRVDEMEERQFVELTEELDDVIAAALALRYAEGGVRAWS